MPRIVSGKTETIHASWWAEGEVCIIKRLSFGDSRRITGVVLEEISTDKLMAIAETPAAERRAASMAQMRGKGQRVTLARLLVGIESMTDSDGNSLEVTEEVVDSLDDRDAQFILDAIVELNPQLGETEAEKLNFQS